MLVQAAMAISIPLLAFKSLTRFGLVYGILGAFLSCIFFYNYLVSHYLLTEVIYVFLMAMYALSLVRYFDQPTVKGLVHLIIICWLITFLRASGSPYFLCLIGGISLTMLSSFIRKNYMTAKNALKHIAIALSIFISTIIIIR